MMLLKRLLLLVFYVKWLMNEYCLCAHQTRSILGPASFMLSFNTKLFSCKMATFCHSHIPQLTKALLRNFTSFHVLNKILISNTPTKCSITGTETRFNSNLLLEENSIAEVFPK